MKQPGASKLGRKYALRPTHPDHRLKAYPHLTARTLGGQLPSPVDHRNLLLAPRDQGVKGYCFAFACSALKEFNCAVYSKATQPLAGHLSPDYLGWRTQLAEGTFGEDAGASLADAMEVLRAYGVAPEDFLPYDAGNPAHAGNGQCDVAARPYRVGMPVSVRIDPDDFAAVLSANRCIAIGFEVHESFEDTAGDGMVQPVGEGERLLGGHAVLVVGWDNYRGGKLFVVRNSWGTDWADSGYCYFPEDYLQHVFDAWSTS